jgi:hypothetical protein
MKTLNLSLLIMLALATAAQAPAQAREEEMEPQFPQQQTAGDLLTACASSRLSNVGRERRRYCAGFVSGVEEAIRLLAHTGRSEFRLCTPAEVSASALADVYVKYGARHQGELADPAAEVVLHALREAYPCPEPKEEGRAE